MQIVQIVFMMTFMHILCLRYTLQSTNVCDILMERKRDGNWKRLVLELARNLHVHMFTLQSTNICDILMKRKRDGKGWF